MVESQALRPEIISGLVNRVIAGEDVRLVGLPLSGRTHVLGQVSAKLNTLGFHVFELRGCPGLSHTPLGALVLAGAEVGPGDRLERLGYAAAWLARQLEHSGAIVLDDAAWLDNLTVSVVRAVADRHQLPILSADVPGREPVSRGNTLSDRSGAQVITLDPLGYDEVHALMAGLLPGPIAQTLVARVAVKTGGLPGLVLAIVKEGTRSGRLRFENGAWDATLDLVTPSLEGPLNLLFHGSGPDQESLRVLALAGPLPLHEATSLVSAPALARLEDRGLLHAIGTEEQTVVAIYPPVLAMHLRRTVPIVLRGEYQKRISAVWGDVAEPDALEPATEPHLWTLTDSASVMVMPQLLRERLSRELAIQRGVWEAEPTPEHALTYVTVMHELGIDVAELSAVAASTSPQGGLIARALLRALPALDAAFRGDDLEGAQRLLGSLRTERPEADGLLRGLEAHCMLTTGRLPDEDLLIDPRADEPSESWDAVRSARAAALCASGRTRDALRELDAHPIDFGYFRVAADLSRGVAQVLEGDPESALAAAGEALDQARRRLDLSSLVTHSYTAALTLTLTGRARELHRHLAAILTLSNAPLLLRQTQGGILSIAAIDAAAQGRIDYARSLANRATALCPHHGPYAFMSGQVGLLLTELLSSPDGSPSARALVDEARQAIDRGLLPVGVILAVTAAENGLAAELAGTLGDVREQVQSDALKRLIDYIDALAVGDVDGLQEVATALTGDGMEYYANRARLGAIKAMRAQGRTTEAAAHALTMWHDLKDGGAETSKIFASLRHDVDLTTREREVANLLSQKMSNHAIANTLVLSVRTVDNHVLHAYRKVGVENREDLAAALDSWLADPSDIAPVVGDLPAVGDPSGTSAGSAHART